MTANEVDVIDEIRLTHDWLDCRELPQIPKYFTTVTLKDNTKIIAELREWIYSNAQGRFAFGAVTHPTDDIFQPFKTYKVVGFEYPADATLFSLSFL